MVAPTVCAVFIVLLVGRWLAAAVYKKLLFSYWTVEGLAAARSRSRSDNTPCCHSLRSRRYATPSLQSRRRTPNYKARNKNKPSPVGESCRKRLLSLLCKRQVARRMRCPYPEEINYSSTASGPPSLAREGFW